MRRAAKTLALAVGLGLALGFGLLACAHAQSPREHALLLVARGDLVHGIEELEHLRDAHPDDPRAWIDLGHAYELAHHFDEALAAYDHAADVAPSRPEGPREGGLRAAAWGDFAAAKPRLLAAIERHDDEPETFHGLGYVLLALGDHAGARRAYLAGLATSKGKDDATCVLGLATLAVAEDDGTEALKWYDELARRRPRVAAAPLGRAWALGRLHRVDEALAALDDAASLGARDGDVAKLRKWIETQRVK